MSAVSIPKRLHRSASAEGMPGFKRAALNRSTVSADVRTCTSSTHRRSMVATAVRASYTTAGFVPGATTNTRNVRDCDIDRRFGSFNSALLIRSSGSVVELSGEVAETVPLVVAVSRRIKVAGNCSCNRDSVHWCPKSVAASSHDRLRFGRSSPSLSEI
jgi:hypothetical protein